ncbi:hypothetical protein [Nonomuraea guangzhouensis]|uniref:Uncharacterized protein n=1 Tax=Nonomuraea guangzhouensis TaxID=1291555 RepID=A0ABW4G5U1_9ACTN|nr:hypothetical protein [Nonomuraea guangzhouensis]
MDDELSGRPVTDVEVALGVGLMVLLLLLPTIIWLATVLLRRHR